MKKVIVLLCLILVLLTIGISFYQYQNRTVECWWGVLYPNLSFIGFEEPQQISALDKNYIPNTDGINFKFAIIEWLKNSFQF